MSDRKSAVDEEQARERLRRERERIEASLRNLDRLRKSENEEVDTAIDPEDDAEVIEEGQVDQALVEQLRTELSAVERAEKRLEDGSYGLSVESGEPIAAERLEAVPWAERSTEEQERYER